jgi:hypothetical protein
MGRLLVVTAAAVLVPYRNFRVIYNVRDPDPHHFDGDKDGIGCVVERA